MGWDGYMYVCRLGDSSPNELNDRTEEVITSVIFDDLGPACLPASQPANNFTCPVYPISSMFSGSRNSYMTLLLDVHNINIYIVCCVLLMAVDYRSLMRLVMRVAFFDVVMYPRVVSVYRHAGGFIMHILPLPLPSPPHVVCMIQGRREGGGIQLPVCLMYASCCLGGRNEYQLERKGMGEELLAQTVRAGQRPLIDMTRQGLMQVDKKVDRSGGELAPLYCFQEATLG